jgi:hypothetical protein
MTPEMRQSQPIYTKSATAAKMHPKNWLITPENGCRLMHPKNSLLATKVHRKEWLITRKIGCSLREFTETDLQEIMAISVKSTLLI